MNFKTFIDSYWELFLIHLCHFHRLEPQFVAKYEDDLNWQALSQNKNFGWNSNLIRKYEQKVSWSLLAMNPSILWNEEMIHDFKKRLDFYYLVRNINLPLTEEFITKHLKKLHFVENNIHLTGELKAKYSDRLLPAPQNPQRGVTEIELQNPEAFFDSWKYHQDPLIGIYDRYILPNLSKYPLEDIFKDKFDYSQRYYYMSPVYNDIRGLTPSYKGDSTNPYLPHTNDRNILNVPDTVPLQFIPDSGSEGPDRILEVLRSGTIDRYAALLISENVKNLLQNFKLPKLRYHSANVTAKKLKITSGFYVLQFDLDTIYNDLIFSSASFVYRTRRMSERSGWNPIEAKIKSTKDILVVKDAIRSGINNIGTFVDIQPVKIPLSTTYDIYTLENRIIVNEFVKETLESNFPGQITFRSAQLLNIRIDQKQYDKKRIVYSNISLKDHHNIFEIPESEKYFRSKKQRLEDHHNGLEVQDLKDDIFKSIQLRLNVIIPETFKILHSKYTTVGEYALLPVEKFYVENQYVESFPESFKAIIVGKNGVGDSIGLMLEKEDDFQLQSTVYEFLHETGEIEKYKYQLT